MKRRAWLGALVLAALAPGCVEGAKDHPAQADHPLVAEGGVGMIARDMYVDLGSARNELVLRGGERWIGGGASERQVVVVFEGRVWALGAAPRDGFELSKAILVSFEGEVVRFVECRQPSGGYYRRAAAR